MKTSVIFQSEVDAVDFPIIKAILEKFKAYGTKVIKEKPYDFYDDLSLEERAKIEKSIAEAERGMRIDNEEVMQKMKAKIYEN